MSPFVTTDNTAITHLSRRTNLPVASSVAVVLAYLILQWTQRQRTRRSLRQLPDYILKDIGLTQLDAQSESNKWFWRR